ncbi:MAG: outer membrane protein assembly factor BamD [Saprospiraceae bacterium]
MRFFIYSLLVISTLTACKSEFEQVRISNDPGRILKTSIKYYDNGDYLRAQTLMELILNQYRGTAQGEELFFKYAYTHFHLANYELAATYFTNFTTTFGYSSYTEEADYMIAYSYYKQSPSFRLDQDPSIKAINAFQDFANKYPESERVPECNKLIDELRSKLEEKAFAQGQLYYDLSQYQAAVTSFKNMLSSFPESSRAETVRFLILKASYEYAFRSVYAKRAERYEDAKIMYTEYMNRYPKGPHAKEAREINKQINSNAKNLSK